MRHGAARAGDVSGGDGTTLTTIDRLVCERVQAAANRVQEKAKFQLSYILILDLDTPNAFATYDRNGGPIVGLHLGMLQTVGTDEDAWAGLLGHEIAHLAMNHRAGRQEAQSSAQTSGRLVGNIVSALIPGIGGAVAGTVSGTATQMAVYGSYTRPQETEADQLGLTWMVEAGYDPRGLTRLFDMLAKHASAPAFLSTHPGAQERSKMVEDYISKREARQVISKD